MPASQRDQFIMVKTKTGRYYHPVAITRWRLSETSYQGEGGSHLRRLGCMEHPTAVWECEDSDLEVMRPCVACAMWIVYGQKRDE